MSGLKLPKDTDEMQEDSSDNESVLEKPKKSTVDKEKMPYVMSEKHTLNCEMMREARIASLGLRVVFLRLLGLVILYGSRYDYGSCSCCVS